MMEILVLIARIILLILEGMTASSAVSKVSGESGVAASVLWSFLPSKYK